MIFPFESVDRAGYAENRFFRAAVEPLGPIRICENPVYSDQNRDVSPCAGGSDLMIA